MQIIKKIIIATPFYEMKGFSPYIRSLTKTLIALEKLKIEYDFFEISGDSYIGRARNTLCARFLESDASHLVMIDSDMEWNVEGFMNLLKADENVIAGNYPRKNAWTSWSCKPILHKDRTPVVKITISGTPLIEAETVSGGFICIKRDFLQRFKVFYRNQNDDLTYYDQDADPENPERLYTAFFENIRRNQAITGEDVGFCQRARNMGEKIYIEPNIDFGHYGVKGWNGNYDSYLKTLKQ